MAEESDEDQSNAQSTRGILFFGVPSQGIDISATRAMVHNRANENFLLSIAPDSEFLRNQQLDFCRRFPYRSCKIFSFYEDIRSPTARQVSLVKDAQGLATNYIVLIGRKGLENGRRAGCICVPKLGHWWRP